MSFAALEARVNAAVMGRLWNARALPVGGEQDFPVVFDADQAVSSIGITAQGPVASCADDDAQSIVSNETLLEIRGVQYLVRDVKPDGAGLTTLVLEIAS